MKKITVAVAALAAGMTTFAAFAQPRSGDRPMVRTAAATKKQSDNCPYLLGCGQTPDKKANSVKTRAAAASANRPKAEPRTVKRAKASSPRAGEVPTAAIAEPSPVPAKRKTASVAPKPVIKRPARSAKKPKLDTMKTASVARSPRPKLAARARMKASVLPGVDDEPLLIAPAPTKMVAASAAGAVPAVRYGAIVSRYAASFGVPERLAHAVIQVESNYRVDALGSAGEIGLMQIKPDTARMMGYTGSIQGLYDPEANIKFGIKYLAMAHKLSGGITCGTILRYNAGHAATRMNPISAAYCSKVKQHLAGI